MKKERNLINIFYEWAGIVVVMIFVIVIFFAVVEKVTKKALTVEAIANLGTLGASLERCYLASNAYAACQGGFFWKNNWNLDVDNPNDDPKAYFEYGVWADNRDWMIAARPKQGQGNDSDSLTFVAMSSYSDGGVVLCGFDTGNKLCKELGIIIPRKNK